MTLDDFFGHLPALGPWVFRSDFGMIRRRADGLCPLQAVCRSLGMRLTQTDPGGTAVYALRLGLPVSVVDDLQDAADGLARTYRRLGAAASELRHLHDLRERLVRACGIDPVRLAG